MAYRKPVNIRIPEGRAGAIISADAVDKPRRTVMFRTLVYVVIVLGVVILAGGAAILEPWKFFQTDVVNEAFPFDDMTEEQQAAYNSLPADMKDGLMAMAADEAIEPAMVRETTEAVLMPDAEVAEEPMPEMAPENMLLGKGEFGRIDAIHAAEGTAAIYQLSDGSRVLRLEDFKSTNGPELHVLLTAGTEATTFGDVGDYVDLGILKGNVGNQNYEIPDDVDLSAIQAVVIWCRPFKVVFSVANLM